MLLSPGGRQAWTCSVQGAASSGTEACLALLGLAGWPMCLASEVQVSFLLSERRASPVLPGEDGDIWMFCPALPTSLFLALLPSPPGAAGHPWYCPLSAAPTVLWLSGFPYSRVEGCTGDPLSRDSELQEATTNGEVSGVGGWGVGRAVEAGFPDLSG